ncbi:MAG: hypothetical protein AB1744_13610, partial [Candidatus Zixiibacteriota bacterium]
MSEDDKCPKGGLIAAFLKHPLNRRLFDRFFRLCCDETAGYLRYLRARGFRLPLDLSSDTDGLQNLAIDLLGTFLASPGGRPFPILMDYFKKTVRSELTQPDPAQLYHRFRALLHGHIRQERTRLFAAQDPQIENLKRRFKETLKEPTLAT